jgi:hypothetical protein
MATRRMADDPSITRPADLTIDLDEDRPHRPRRVRYLPTRNTIATAALTIAAGALTVVYAVGSQTPPTARSVAPAQAAAPAQADPARFVTPATAAPGERLTVLAYRNTTLCGPAVLHLDGAAVPQRVLSGYTAGQEGRSHRQFFMSMDVPRTARPGTHRIDLWGPLRASGGDICADVPERPARIASAVIVVIPPLPGR